MNFEDFQLKTSPNQYLLCPKGMSTRAKPNDDSPIFDVPIEALQRVWREVALRQPRVAMIRDDREINQCEFVQRSLVFRFPDTMTVEFFAIDDERSTCAVYSRSKYGYGDLGVNRRRVRKWVRLVQNEIARDAVQGQGQRR
ncbi:MAG: DUF1499 domain-containing protein [Proteobacteria bacterium]|nr:DUF1499 domain-containing protein [Pseudomonadota bacterium]